MKYIIIVCALVAAAFSTPAQAQRMTQEERIALGQMRAAEQQDRLMQYQVDLAKARCERNGGQFDMNEVRFDDRIDTRRDVRARDRGAVYQRGRTTVIDVPRLILGPPRPEVDTRSNADNRVRISQRACVYPKVNR